jgi:hypothetical protein
MAEIKPPPTNSDGRPTDYMSCAPPSASPDALETLMVAFGPPFKLDHLSKILEHHDGDGRKAAAFILSRDDVDPDDMIQELEETNKFGTLMSAFGPAFKPQQLSKILQHHHGDSRKAAAFVLSRGDAVDADDLIKELEAAEKVMDEEQKPVKDENKEDQQPQMRTIPQRMISIIPIEEPTNKNPIFTSSKASRPAVPEVQKNLNDSAAPRVVTLSKQQDERERKKIEEYSKPSQQLLMLAATRFASLHSIPRA